MLKLGAAAPDFSLTDTDGTVVSKSDFAGSPLLVMFICNHCPYVKHVAPELSKLGDDYADSPLGIIAIQSNDVEAYPDDSLEMMQLEVTQRNYSFPYLLDESQQVAIDFSAACTPDFFLFDANHDLVYRGQLDKTRPTRVSSGVYDSKGNEPTGADLRAAINLVLKGEAPGEGWQFPSLGCNIKWKPGKEPSYFKPA